MASNLQYPYFQINLPEVRSLASLFTIYTVSPSAGYFTTIHELQKHQGQKELTARKFSSQQKLNTQFWFCKCIFKFCS